MIHDERGNLEWSNDVEPLSESRFSDKDVVIGDGYASFKTMTIVHQIGADAPNDSVVHKGVFWEGDLAEQFAELLEGQDDE